MNLASIFRFSSSLVAVLDASDGRVVDVNPEMVRVFGMPRDQMLGRQSIELGFWVNLETRAEIWAQLRSDKRVSSKRVVF
ncbi:MAG TPA: PAS domain-containing protein, partial [Rudaea sp.]|nr:PAS domain-containing protein [Rudaea sp.]